MAISDLWNYPRNMVCIGRITADAFIPGRNGKGSWKIQEQKGSNDYGSVMGRKIYKGNR